MSFCAAINCMDGRVQLPVIRYLQQRFDVAFVDMITEPGPCRILAEGSDDSRRQAIFERCDLSVAKHRAVAIAVVAHHDCAGNPVHEAVQRRQLAKSLETLRGRYNHLTLIALCVDERLVVHEVPVEA